MPYSKDELLNDALRNALKTWKKFTQKLEALVAKTPEPTRFERWGEVRDVVQILGHLHDKLVQLQEDIDNKTADKLTIDKAQIIGNFLTQINAPLNAYNESTSVPRADASLEKVELEDLNKLINKLYDLTPNPCPEVLKKCRNRNKEFALIGAKLLPFAGIFVAAPIAGIFIGCLAGFGSGWLASGPIRTRWHLDDPRPDSQRYIETLNVRLGQVQHKLAERLRCKSTLTLKAC